MSKPQKVLYSKIDNLIIRPSGPWIQKKHFYLKRYAEIFTKGMKKKWGQLTFIDFFAGPGRCIIRKTHEEMDGSPLLALTYGFTHYIFIEQNDDDFSALGERCRKSPKYNQIRFLHGDCNKEIGKISPQGLSLAFIDPTGIDIHFETIRTLNSLGPTDLLMNVPFQIDIKRNFQKYIKEQHKKLDLFLGGNIPWPKMKGHQDILALYRERVKALGYKTVEYSDILVTNTKNSPMYFLFFASKHPRGLDFWKKITNKDEKGQFELGL